MGVKVFEIPVFNTSAEQREFEAELEDAEENGFSVEFLTREDQIVVIQELMGEKLGKAYAKKAMDRALDGGNLSTCTEVILRAQGAVGQLGQLIPDISCYPANFTFPLRIATPPHPLIAVEIDWIEDCNAALNKVLLYFAPSFMAPDGSMIMEVWNLFLPHTAPTAPALTEEPLHTQPLPFTGVEDILNAATVMEEEEPTVLVFHHRNGVYPPSYGVLDWNTSLSAPVGSRFMGRLNCNTILLMAYGSKTQLPELHIQRC